MSPAAAPAFDGAVAAGIAGMVLHATADALDPDPDAVPGAMANLATLAMLPLDISAGVLLATTSLTGTTTLTADQLRELAGTYTAQAEEEVTS